MNSSVLPLIQVNRNFLRSVRLDTDFGRADALQGYVLQPSARSALETISHHVLESQQRAFTWTGPYGGGKSSLALALASLAAGNATVRSAAKKALGLTESNPITRCFGTKKPWKLISIVGSRESVTTAIANAVQASNGENKTNRSKRFSANEVIGSLVDLATSDSNYEGLIVVIDELGKLLEHAAAHDEDINFYQELAETASRVKGKLIVIGILHQAFDQYAVRLGNAVQQDWAKVQGRYVDIPIVASADEAISLIGKALSVTKEHKYSKGISKTVAEVVKRRKPSSSDNLTELLDKTWPLHPVTALLLGPISRKKFSQNERSIFSFLASAEPLSLLEYLKEMPADSIQYYYPADLWNYLRTNFTSAILSSPDSHRWVVCSDAIGRAESKFTEAHIRLVQTIATIEMFRDNSGLSAEKEILETALLIEATQTVDGLLSDLVAASILVYRKHTGSYGIYAGSDFDIESATTQAKHQLGINEVTQTVQDLTLSPITARRHYWETGAMRWLVRCVVSLDQLDEYASNFELSSTLTGAFLLVMRPQNMTDTRMRAVIKKASEAYSEKGILVGFPKDTNRILNLASEVAALAFIKQNSKELHGDSVASTEVNGRLQALGNELQSDLKNAFLTTTWYFQGEICHKQNDEAKTVSQIASYVADTIYSEVPTVLSELVNRNDVSSSASKAQRDLLHRMLNNADEEALGYKKQSADAGLFFTVIHRLGLHQLTNNRINFVNPKRSNKYSGETLIPAWKAAETLLYKPNSMTSLSDLYALWSLPPFGIKKGLLPIFALTFFLANRNRLALYVEKTFIPELTDAYIDEWLQDPRRISWRFVKIDGEEKVLLTELSKALRNEHGHPITLDPLDSARSLVAIVFNLPIWVRRTETLSNRTKKIRRLLLNASDPHKVLFQDLPVVLETTDPVEIAKQVAEVAEELTSAYSNRLKAVEKKLFKALDQTEQKILLVKRAETVKAIAADFKLDAFAARLANFEGETKDLEGLLMLAIGKPTKDWTDHDLNAGEVQLMKWAFEFRRIETMSHLKGLSSTRRAIGIVFSGGETVSGEIDVSTEDQPSITALAKSLVSNFDKSEKPEVLLAAIAEAGAMIYKQLVSDRSEIKND